MEGPTRKNKLGQCCLVMVETKKCLKFSPHFESLLGFIVSEIPSLLKNVLIYFLVELQISNFFILLFCLFVRCPGKDEISTLAQKTRFSALMF